MRIKTEWIDALVDKLTKAQLKELQSSYKLALRNTKEEIEKLYMKMGNNPSLAQAEKYKRLQTLKNKIKEEVNFLTKTKITGTNNLLVDTYSESYNGFIYQTGKQMGIRFDFTSINKLAALELVRNPIQELTVPALFADHKAAILKAMNIEITQGLIRGIGYVEMAKEMVRLFDIDYNKIKSVSWTEGHRALQKARLDSFDFLESKGIEGKKRWLATLDERTRPAHQAADGQEVPSDGKFTVGGVKMEYPGDPAGGAENTIRCRCSMTYITEGTKPFKRRAGTETVDFDLTYDEWKKQTK
jgi:SPP1 gp7 family putative phage head morphogenesis protein